MTAEMLQQQRGSAPFHNFRTMHHNVGLELRTLQVTHGIKKRFDGDLFQFLTTFTLTKVQDGLEITNQTFTATDIGRRAPHHAVAPINVCGCTFRAAALLFFEYQQADDLVAFLADVQRGPFGCALSCNVADLGRSDEKVYRDDWCWTCRSLGQFAVSF